MKINRITIRDFRGISQFSAATDTALLLLGPNGYGKSSVLEAVRYALYGRCLNTDKRGAGAFELIKDGAREANITLTLDVDGREITIINTIPVKGKAEWVCHDGNGEIIEDRAGLWAVAGISQETAEATGLMYDALATGGFGDMLSVALADALPWGTVMDHAKEHADWLTEFADHRGMKPSSVAEYQALGQAAYARRTEINRQLKDATENLEAVRYLAEPTNSEGNPLTVADIPGLRQELARIQLAHDEALERRGRVSGNRAAATIASELKVAEAALAKAEKAATTATEKHNDAWRIEDEAKSEAGRLAREDSRIRGELARIDGVLRSFQNTKCANCGTPISAETINKLVGKQGLEADLAAVREQSDAFTAKKPAYEKAIKDANANMQDAMRALAGPREKVAALRTEVPSDPSALDAINAELETLAESKQQIGDALHRLELLQGRDTGMVAVAELTAEVAHLNFAVESFKDGVLLKALMPKGKRDAFLTALNRELGKFGYQATLQQDGKTLGLMLGAIDSKPRHWKRCSDGERCVAEICCAMVYSRGRTVVLVDNIDRLDAKNKEALRKVLATANQTVIMACAWGQSALPSDAMVKAFAPATVKWMGAAERKEVAA